jgi:hypothetical protein
MLTALAATIAIVTSDTIDSVRKSVLANIVSGIASAGAKLVPLAKDV